MRCDECKYYAVVEDALRSGRCHRFPPKQIAIWNSEARAYDYEHEFPWVDKADWCGEHELNETKLWSTSSPPDAS